MDARLILTFLLPFLKELIYGKPVYETNSDKRTFHSNVISRIQKSRRIIASMVLVTIVLAFTNIYTFNKLATVSVVSREDIVRLKLACQAKDYKPAAVVTDTVTDKPTVPVDNLDGVQKTALQALGL